MPNSHTEEELLQKSNVVGVGYGLKNGTGPFAVIVNVTRKLPQEHLSDEDLVPPEVEDLPTDVVETGIIRAYFERPARGGASIGHVNITAGTLGCVVRRGGRRVILSNNHVLANSNAAEIGDPIIQPGDADGGIYPRDHIANLEAYQRIFFDGEGLENPCSIASTIASGLNAVSSVFGRQTRLVPERQLTDNLVDAAVALPLEESYVSDEIRDIGFPEGLAEAGIGMSLMKTGRTTGLTTGTVIQTETTIQVQFGMSRVATFRDQILTTDMSQPGDSGSVVLDSSNRLVGLLFAGSPQVTVLNRITNVFDALDLEL